MKSVEKVERSLPRLTNQLKRLKNNFKDAKRNYAAQKNTTITRFLRNILPGTFMGNFES